MISLIRSAVRNSHSSHSPPNGRLLELVNMVMKSAVFLEKHASSLKLVMYMSKKSVGRISYFNLGTDGVERILFISAEPQELMVLPARPSYLLAEMVWLLTGSVLHRHPLVHASYFAKCLRFTWHCLSLLSIFASDQDI